MLKCRATRPRNTGVAPASANHFAGGREGKKTVRTPRRPDRYSRLLRSAAAHPWPLAQAIACFTPAKAARLFSRAATCGPRIHCPPSTAFRNRAGQRRSQPLALRLQVNKGDGFGHDSSAYHRRPARRQITRCRRQWFGHRPRQSHLDDSAVSDTNRPSRDLPPRGRRW